MDDKQLKAKLRSAETSRDFLAQTMTLIHEALGRKGQSFQSHELPGQVQVQRAALMVAIEALERIVNSDYPSAIATNALMNPLMVNEITRERRRKEIEEVGKCDT